LYTSESENSRPLRTAAMVPSTAALKFLTQPSLSIHDWAWGIETRALRSRYGAQEPPVIVTESSPSGMRVPAVERIGPTGWSWRVYVVVTVGLISRRRRSGRRAAVGS